MRNQHGFTLVEIMLVVGLIGMLIAIALPAFTKPRELAQQNICIDNLRLIDTAKQMYAFEQNAGGSTELVPENLDPYLKRGTDGLVCPRDPAQTFVTSYQMGTFDEAPECKIVPEKHLF